MSLTKVSLSSVVRLQYRYKLKAYTGVFMGLILVQVIGILLSIVGSMGSSFSNNVYTVEVSVFSPSLVIILTMIWAFLNAILMTTKAYREDDFTFVSNRLSYNLSNMAFLLTACVIGALTALLSSGIIQLLSYLTRDIDVFLTVTHDVTTSDYVAGAVVTLLYILLAATVGYLIGMMTQFNKRLIILLPVILVGLNYIAQRNGNTGFVTIIEFYFMEYSFSIFLLKAMVTLLIGSGLAILLSNRLEVR
jgi:hypothetical protein